MARRGAGIRDHTPEQLHALRKSVKKLRYGAEFFAGLYPPRQVRRYLKRMERLQALLGTLNDAATTALLLEHIPAKGWKDGPSPDALDAWAQAAARRGASHLDRAWRRFEETEPFWK